MTMYIVQEDAELAALYDRAEAAAWEYRAAKAARAMAGAGRASGETVIGTQASPSARAQIGMFAGNISQPVAPAHSSSAVAASTELGEAPSRRTAAHGEVTISHMRSPSDPGEGPGLSSSLELATVGDCQDAPTSRSSPGRASTGGQSATFLNPFAMDAPRGFHSASADSAGHPAGGLPRSSSGSATAGRGVSRRSNSGGSTGGRASGSATPLRRCELTPAILFARRHVLSSFSKVFCNCQRANHKRGKICARSDSETLLR
jgi:hypothetical protein